MTFNLPEPDYIVIGDQLLETHLREAGEDFCFVTRSVLGKLDWSDFESCYKPGGRHPYHPQLMLGIVLYGIAKGVTSLRGLERLARLDLGCMWVSGGACPDHSALCRFLNKHAELLTDDFFTALTREVLSITKSDCSSVAGDGTVIQAAASRFGAVKREAAEHAQRQAMVEPVYADIKHIQGLLRFRRKGLSAVRLEFYLHACAHNLRRAAAALAAAMAYFAFLNFGAQKKLLLV